MNIIQIKEINELPRPNSPAMCKCLIHTLAYFRDRFWALRPPSGKDPNWNSQL